MSPFVARPMSPAARLEEGVYVNSRVREAGEAHRRVGKGLLNGPGATSITLTPIAPTSAASASFMPVSPELGAQ